VAGIVTAWRLRAALPACKHRSRRPAIPAPLRPPASVAAQPLDPADVASRVASGVATNVAKNVATDVSKNVGQRVARQTATQVAARVAAAKTTDHQTRAKKPPRKP
jgi:hypothetical protein